jgi:hypothetical protein
VRPGSSCRRQRLAHLGGSCDGWNNRVDRNCHEFGDAETIGLVRRIRGASQGLDKIERYDGRGARWCRANLETRSGDLQRARRAEGIEGDGGPGTCPEDGPNHGSLGAPTWNAAALKVSG